MKKRVMLATLILMTSPLVAQDSLTVPKKFKYFFTINTGFLGGERMKSITFSANTVHGITIGKRFRVGVGIGIDSYRDVQTMPLFGQVSFDLIQFENRNSVFLQANYGWSHAWPQVQDGYVSNPTSGGKTHGLILGYRFAVGEMNISLGAGYKYQETRSSYQSPFVIDWASSIYSPYSQVINHNYERFAVMVGVGWR